MKTVNGRKMEKKKFFLKSKKKIFKMTFVFKESHNIFETFEMTPPDDDDDSR